MIDDSIPICRSVFKHWIYKDADYLKSWLTMLGRAKYTTDTKIDIYQNIPYQLNRGEFIFGRKKWCEATGISEDKIRRLITLLLSDGMIKLVAFKGKFTIYSIVNYDKFNQPQSVKIKGVKLKSPPTDLPTDLPTDHQQTYQQTTTNEEGNKESNKESNKECNIKDFVAPLFELEVKDQPPFYVQVLDYLNQKAGTGFKHLDSHKKYISARQKDGYCLDDFKKVIDKKCAEWLGTDQQKFLRPETLFSNKFDGYLNQSVATKPQPTVGGENIPWLKL